MTFTLDVNGVTHRVDVGPDTPLLWVPRDGSAGPHGAGILGLCGSQKQTIDTFRERRP